MSSPRRFKVLLLLFFFTIFAVTLPHAAADRVCPAIKSIKDSIITITISPVCTLNHGLDVIEGDETSLTIMVNKNAQAYVVYLFYASWCPFSLAFRPTLSLMASLYPSIPHFAIQQSVIRPSILSKYGVHGFPTLIILNSTMRVRYHGSRTLDSLIHFYTNVTGIKPESINETTLMETVHKQKKRNISGAENCPFSWAQSPVNMLQHETYLTLATIFVVLRLVYLSYPFIMTCARVSWRRRNLNIRFKSLWKLPLLYMNRAIQLFTSLTEPCKRSNLHGAINAKAKAAWASKSLASVSFGEARTSRDGV
ncbi:5'-adenylylsulfate reductase-like 4 [Bidens hawaiensis]|uniref:5'-adenylylsulfate reductase-like 4 n=1 Tax=Bidens hawaiensis TaxID=980011 RepID=UPI00404A81A3